jgi:hypothetical protein
MAEETFSWQSLANKFERCIWSMDIPTLMWALERFLKDEVHGEAFERLSTAVAKVLASEKDGDVSAVRVAYVAAQTEANTVAESLKGHRAHEWATSLVRRLEEGYIWFQMSKKVEKTGSASLREFVNLPA